jgi:competence ComEA-like helix-hairpin-helix protein
VTTTPQERLALGVAALLLAAGAVARSVGGAPPHPVLEGGTALHHAAPPSAAVRDSLERAARRRTPLAPGERIDPNLAPVDELSRLPRVGPSLAARIVAWREERGPFRTLADFDSVPGVGPAVLREAAPFLALAPARPGAPAAASAARAGRPGSAGARGPIDPNRATAAELTTLPGIGPALAERIVASREEEGRFRTVDDLRRVRGIGPAVLERLRGSVQVTP